MSLKEWVASVGGPTAAARLIGVSRWTISAWLDRVNQPTAPALEALVKKSKGALTYQGVIDETRPRQGGKGRRSHV